MSALDQLSDHLNKSVPYYVGPRGGKWENAAHTIPYKEVGKKVSKRDVKKRKAARQASADKERAAEQWAVRKKAALASFDEGTKRLEARIEKEKEEKATKEKAIKTAEDMGAKAFARGVKKAPSLDKEFSKLITGPVGSGIKIMEAWHRGWDKANLAPEKSAERSITEMVKRGGESKAKVMTAMEKFKKEAYGDPSKYGGGFKKSTSAIDALEDHLEKAGPYIGPKGGKWADVKHTIPWHDGDKTKQMKSKLDNLRSGNAASKKRLEATRARIGAKKKELKEIHSKTSAGMSEKAEKLKAEIKEVEAKNKKADRGLAREDRKADKSMSALDALEEHLEKGFVGGYGLEWADRMSGSPFEVDALQCLRDSAAISAEMVEARKKNDMPWQERQRMDPVERAKLNKKNDAMYQKFDVKEAVVRKKRAEIEKKFLDWRIEKAKEYKKGEESNMDDLKKSELPTGQPTNVDGGPENGGPLEGKGKPAGTDNPPNPEEGQDADGMPTGVPTPTVQDWSEEEEARRVIGGGTMKSMGSLDHDRALAEKELRKGPADVHPLRMSEVHGDTEKRIAELRKGGVNQEDPRNAIIAKDTLCKSCDKSHTAMLTACPHCGEGQVAQEMSYKSDQSVVLDDDRGAPIFRPSNPVQKDILIKE